VTPLMARLVAVATAFLLAATLGVLYFTSNPGTGDSSVKAEFEDTFPLLPGMHVRVFGAVAGSVDDVELTDHGTAVVTMRLNEGTAPPSSDATASIRQQDITGDSYVSLSPGDSAEPLGDDVIPTSRTLVAPRFDDLLNSFDPQVREGLQLLFVELGKALERRGEDLNAAALHLRPGLEAANQALAEVRSQNLTLKQLVLDAEQVTGQAAGRARELGALVDSLATTTRATAAHAPALDRALEVAPETAAAARDVLTRLERAAIAGRPLALTLASAAPDLAQASILLGPFVADASAALEAAEPTLRLVERLLRASEPTLATDPEHALTAPFDLAAASGGLLDTLLGDPALMRSLFGADAYGQGPSKDDDVGLGSLAVELGTQDGYPGNDPERRFLRAKPILNCEVFGLPIEPGCLLDFLSNLSASRTPGPRSEPGQPGAGGGAPDAPGDAGDAGRDERPRKLPDRIRDLLDETGLTLKQLLDQTGLTLKQLLKPGGLGGVLNDGGGGGSRGGGGGGQAGDPVGDLLDFLFGP
jgi:phospholipid/cholesterol/gamma-HCH transport system substrate-binding protein